MPADLSEAACAGANPALFDCTTFPDAQKALAYCGRCAILVACMEWVRPSKSYYDGVAAGIVWRNGYKVRPDNSTREDRMRRNEAS